MNQISVFCGSSLGHDPQVIEVAEHVGKTFAEQGITLVYGAAKIGIMGRVAQSCLDHNGRVIGVIPEFLKLKEVVHLGLTQVITTHSMHQRKQKMFDLSDAFIALPGGFGTLEELLEMLTWAQLGLHQKPIGVLNVNGYYDDLMKLSQTMNERGFLKTENLDLLIYEDNIEILIERMRRFEPQPVPKWLTANS